ncbi:MAG: Nif11-like leader peptide family RiPP precursor [Ruminiclostridium sp.]|nr:Nif11-like leader peptide family RiPP precursor [Ruminiclostridium sp.]
MKTLQELYSEITKSDELKKQFTEAAKNNTVVDFAKSNGVETTMDEIQAFLEEKQKDEKELSPEELENAAGGTCNKETGLEITMSIFTVGVSCAGNAIASAVIPGMKVGQETDGEGRLCSIEHDPSRPTIAPAPGDDGNRIQKLHDSNKI